MPTMADVARSAGVSVATVSHVLNGTRPVLPHTRQAVLDAVDELGYTPNTLARSLVTSRTRSIGLAVSAISNPYFTEILQGVEAGALEHGYSLLIADPHDDPGHERKVVQLLHERRVDGMIVAPSADPRELVSYLARHQVPTVFLDRVVDGVSGGSAGGVVGEVAGGSVGAAVGGGAGGVVGGVVGGATGEAVGGAAARGTTGEAVGEAATRGTTGEAVSGAATRGTTGHAGGDAVRPANGEAVGGAARGTTGEAAGGTALGATGEAVGGAGTESAGLGADAPVGGSHRFDQVCAENTEPMAGLVTHLAGLGHRRIGLVAGLPGLSTTAERIAGYRQGLTAAGLPYDDHLVVHGNSESAGAERATTALLSLPVPPTALVTANNAMTIGTLRALRTHGLSVPDDLALCCFDDFAWADLFSPRLTAIAQPSREIGARAVRVLLERLDRPDRPARTVRLDCTFMHRTSCGCPDPGEGARPSWSA
ncbi:DNA-binding LacI/PurR family transcriptional regulator [Streptomyces sp. SAI-117]|uniref:LacI family DNA-binding transcriptional regulator n=1 Tax=Streptomyces sp. SAI-117 TaxID=2940546 RepID=UPI0024770BBE|nr:LacI family DNA-binding transcriptional regulator [Streptomyces sp. SAI-117]MDH6571153.1 DNA-binding LacI/PurR family transcriptional regulator [Streptomyces sp. SAI-117]